MPMFNTEFKRWETSICRMDLSSLEKVLAIGAKVREPKPVLAYAELSVRQVAECNVEVLAAPVHDYAEHAVIVKWPEEKERQKAIASELVYRSRLSQLT